MLKQGGAQTGVEQSDNRTGRGGGGGGGGEHGGLVHVKPIARGGTPRVLM